MTRKAISIIDSLDDIKRIMYYHNASIDYSQYIEDLNGYITEINNMFGFCENDAEKVELEALKARAESYLEKIKEFQKVYENSLESEEMGK